MERQILQNAVTGQRGLTAVTTHRITVDPGKGGCRHLHPCPVIGYILRGTARFQIEGGPVQHLPEGSTFYEPADTVILYFENASDTEEMVFLANYLLHGDQELIRML